jgi:rhodanese-related sulfurtransferase
MKFENTGMLINNIRFVSPREAFALSESGAVIIDIRPDYETLAKKIVANELVYIYWQDFELEYQMLNSEREFIVMDEVGIHCKDIVKFLVSQHFTKVAAMAGGIFDWERDGLPIDIDKNELLTGSCACTLKPKKRFNKT